MSELKPCLFCGGKAEVCEGGINGKMQVYGLVEHKDGCFFLADGLPTKYQHIMQSEFDAWNTRAERTCKWEYPQSVNGWVGYEVCSNCGAKFDECVTDIACYCPNCGAKVVDH